MASSNECSEATQVLLVDPQSLPVLLQSDPEGSTSDISVDLLQQALQGASAMDDGDEDESAEEVSLDALSGGNNDVVAIYQGEEGQTHTIKISLAEAQSLGLNFSSGSFPVSLSEGSLVGGMKIGTIGDQLTDENSGALTNANILQGVTCSNVATEGRIIDEDGNIVETSESLQILPTSLSSLLEEGMDQSLSIVPQYELDGTVTYAVKLKDQNDGVLGTDYHVLEPDSSAKTGLDIEEELKTSNLRQTVLQPTGAIPAGTLGLTSSVSLSSDSNSTSPTIQVPISTLEVLSKQMLLPVSSASVPISVTLSIPTETSVSSLATSVSSSNNLASPNTRRFFQILTDHGSVGLNNVISSNSTSVPLSTIVQQPTLTINPQQPQLISQSATLLNVQNSPITLLGNNRNVNQPVSRKQSLTDRLQPILPCPKTLPSSSLKATTAFKKMSLTASAVTPTAIASTSVHSPAMASVAPITTQSHLGGASVSKSALSNGRVSSSISNSSKPLGSSENPIQLVQQGQTFHSMQALSQAQLRQIATVLQQKHLNSNSAATKNVLFDEQTKTRIVYRVVYPEDVDLQQPSSPTEKSGSSASQTSKLDCRSKGRRGRPKKPKQRKPSSLDRQIHKKEQAGSSYDPANPQMSQGRSDSSVQEEIPKVEKKKILGSRTRSGRVSRPPKHMMKDFKHLHHTDYRDRDDDESDGGYSDYSNPEQPLEKPVPLKEVEVSPVKKRISPFTCPTCNKVYLGLRRMEKHFTQHPDHGSFEEFKQRFSASSTAETSTSTSVTGEKDPMASNKTHHVKGKKRSQASTEKERSEIRKRKLKQALQACEISEVMEVAGPLIARYYSLWDLLLLRLIARVESNVENEINERCTWSQNSGLNGNDGNFDPQRIGLLDQGVNTFSVDSGPGNIQTPLSTSNRVQWLLMELSSLADTLQTLAGDIFQPAGVHGNEKSQIEINQKTVSEMLGVSCGTYSVNEEHLVKKMESFSVGSKQKTIEDSELPPEKRSRKLDEPADLNLTLNHEGPEVSPEDISSLSLMVKPVDDDKVMLAKLTEDMPFLNSSDDMICGSEDPDLSTDSKRDQDCDPAAGLKAVDDIVNERLKNLGENMNFAVPLQSGMNTSNMNDQQSGLHLMTGFGGTETPISVSNASVISSSLTGSDKPTVSVTNMDLISSYSIPSLSRSGAHDMNISNSESSNDLASALEPVTSQGMLSSFGMGLSSLTSFDSLQSQTSAVPHSEDSFLESLSSFETPLTQSCSSSNAPGPSFDDSVMKNNPILHLTSESSEAPHLPPKFISSFTPAITNDKTTNSISTAQRLQRSYLELDDLVFEAFTQ